MSEYLPVEQDYNVATGEDELPTYDDLAEQSGPNSRFGRWRGWIEKRAAERYLDITPEDRAKRRERGWGNDDLGVQAQAVPAFPVISGNGNGNPIPDPAEGLNLEALHIDSDRTTLNTLVDRSDTLNSLYTIKQSLGRSDSPPLPPLPFLSEDLPPTHLKVNHFGSRFLPHTTSQIRCLLPIQSGKLLLIGHDEGLSVLDMFPEDWTDSGGVAMKGPDEAHAKLIWKGEGVYQMDYLEVENIGEELPQGVVLFLCGPDHETSAKDLDSLRSLRMYNLTSLINLARWAARQKISQPLDFHKQPSSQSPTGKQTTMARGSKSIAETPSAQTIQPFPYSTFSRAPSTLPLKGSVSFQASSSRRPSSSRFTPFPSSSMFPPALSTNFPPTSWEVVPEDMPLRWATDFVPLASTGSRMSTTSVISYAIWSDENRQGKGGQLLAVATKNNILLYETPKGERAFKYVKDFYTPSQPRSMTFFHQSSEFRRTLPDAGRFHSHNRSDSSSTLHGIVEEVQSSMVVTNLSIFVVFDKRGGWIRISDSAVGELELGDAHVVSPNSPPLSTISLPHAKDSLLVSPMRTKGRHSSEAYNSSWKWVAPVRCELPVPGEQTDLRQKVYLFTRGRTTHIVPFPLPADSSLQVPLHVLTWRSTPRQVAVRVCEPSSPYGAHPVPPFLQVIGFGEQGLEVQETALSFLSVGKGKGKATLIKVVRADGDFDGETGFLCMGGHWDQTHRLFNSGLSRNLSTRSGLSMTSFDSLASDELRIKLKSEEGVYGWVRKGVADWRVFWVGGTPTHNANSVNLGD